MAGLSGLIGQLVLFRAKEDQNQEEDTVHVLHSSAMGTTLSLKTVSQRIAQVCSILLFKIETVIIFNFFDIEINMNSVFDVQLVFV